MFHISLTCGWCIGICLDFSSVVQIVCLKSAKPIRIIKHHFLSFNYKFWCTGQNVEILYTLSSIHYEFQKSHNQHIPKNNQTKPKLVKYYTILIILFIYMPMIKNLSRFKES